MIKATHKPTDFSVLVRAYGKGSELIIDRNQEIIVCLLHSMYLKHLYFLRILLPLAHKISVHRYMLDLRMV